MSRAELLEAAHAKRTLEIRDEAQKYQESLAEFTKAAWPYIDKHKYIHNWHIDAIAEHLEAVAKGWIKRLIINIPYRSMKSSLVSVAYPAWRWTKEPSHQFLCGAHREKLASRDNNKQRRLVMSPWYQARWGKVFSLTGDQNEKMRFENDKGGYRIGFGMNTGITGDGGDTVIIDDPMDRDKAQSDAYRTTTLETFDQSVSTRLNDPDDSAIIVIMQRLHQSDLSGHLLEQKGEYEHLMIPMEYERSRRCVTVLKRDVNGKPEKAWADPRKVEGELFWPARWTPKAVEAHKKRLGPYGTSGQFQQNPEPIGGGIIKREWWKLWDQNYPTFSHILGCVDTAFTEKTQNDPSALTIWGVFHEPKTLLPKVMLIYAWEGRKELHGLVEILAAMCSKDAKAKHNGYADVPSFPVDRLIIEGKTSGISVAQELARLYGNINSFSVELVNPDKWGDKVARVTAVQHMFADGMVYAGARKENDKPVPRSFSKMVIDQMAVFPYGAHDDLTDTASMALLYLRQVGFLERRDEFTARSIEEMTYKKPLAPLYEVI